MLDKTTFLREIAILAELYNRPELSEVLIARYFEYLNQRLTTPEFEFAAKRIFEEERFWPAPITFVTYAKGDPKLEAVREWDQLVEHASRGELAPLSDPGKAALRSIGGWPRLQNLTEHDQASVRRQFLDSYTTRSTPSTPVLDPPKAPVLSAK